ncbi:S-adenosylmethionine synthase [Hymenobacter sp. DG25B]|uniref:methionine adenosyltransferase n=1 Tax=Hymenobacter sp. DG25B TaxID=1385664 RepID=UPI00054076D8|nr:methionine adenosyltransferase [Hymenobacter sp. DG25B]AIZ64800.1 S-adenosylmethionine synthase [Hymenobacter sp. DG25B]
MSYLFTSESVSEGHPDKVADQISDAILDEYLRQDPASKVACETLVTTDFVLVAGEIKSKAHVDAEPIAREVIRRIGYNKPEYLFNADTCEVMNRLHEQSPDINQGVERAKDEEQGAGDQGMMFGYATNETENYMPLALDLSHRLLEELARIRKAGQEMTYLRPDAKSQVTIRYADDNTPQAIETIVVSTQHDEFDASEEKMLKQISEDIRHILIPRVKAGLGAEVQRLFTDQITYHINPTGKFVIGGPHGDTGLTGRKIIVDTYGGKGAHGGGAFSGKDSSKVDRSAAYATRHIAKNLVAAGVADQVLVQVAYAIGVAQPVGLYVTTYGTTKVKGANGQPLTDGEIAEKVNKLFDMRPYAIVKRFGLQNPIFGDTAAYGHLGRRPGTKQVTMRNGEVKTFETFTWEKLDYVDKIKAEFGL